MSLSAVLVSVRPKHMDRILEGKKKVEIRRIRPRVSGGDMILFYESSPTKKLVASARVMGIDFASPEMLWASSGGEAALPRDEFMEYLTGLAKGVAIRFSHLVKLEPGIPLADLRALWPGFHPPQTHMYVSHRQVDKLRSVKRKHGSELQLSLPSLLPS